MTLSELIKNLPVKRIIGSLDIPIKGIAYDSRQVNKSYLFAAIQGEHVDGRTFVTDAIKRGALAILLEEPMEGIDATQVIAHDVREAMARLASHFYGEPSRNMTLIGVTGTNGKTTTTYLLESILRCAGFHVGVIGTINYRYLDKVFDAPHTTPEAPDLQKILKEMLEHKVTHCVMEVSSHALVQKRVNGCKFVGAVFTNLTQDHLDYHKTMEAYFKSKSMLFTDFLAKEKNGFAVINIDDTWGEKLLKKCQMASASGHAKRASGGGGKCQIYKYSLEQNAEIKSEKAIFSEHGIEARLATPIGSLSISSHLLGEYNLQNIMAAAGIGIGLGLDRRIIESGIADMKSVDGRLERIISKEGFQGVVDYAHTGDALERVLKTLRQLTQGRLITVFGCGGDRDRGKRPLMGGIATQGSDFTIVTSDNPRSEDPLEIIKEIEKGIAGVKRYETLKPMNGKGYMIRPDRLKAIKAAVRLAAPQDIVLVAGKGHEDYQIVGDRRIHFNDREELKRAMEERQAKSL